MDLLNELQYNFGGTKAVTEGARDRTLTPDDLKPTWFQSLLGTTTEDLQRARYQGELERFKETGLAQEAEQYGITVAPTGSGRLNQSTIRTAVDNEKELRGLISQYRQLGGTMDTTDMTIGQVGNLIRQRNTQNTISDTQTAQNLAWNSPMARDERAVRDRRYYDQQKANLQDRIDQREDRKLEFEYQKMRDRKADMQYNERLEQLDRKDRKMAMQNLAAGLASLGAAFAM